MTMSMRLAGRVALVTGASRGIGAAIALRLAADGANVVVNYHSNREAADGIVHEIVSRGGNAHALQADIKQVADVEHLIVEATRLYGGLNILVNNAGQAGSLSYESFYLKFKRTDFSYTETTPETSVACVTDFFVPKSFSVVTMLAGQSAPMSVTRRS